MPDSIRPLQGKTIIITKPSQQSQYLSQQIQALGGIPVLLPSLAIAPIEDNQHLREIAASLKPTDIVIFISPNAVTCCMPVLQAHYTAWPQHQQWLAVGLSTAQALQAYQVRQVSTPSQSYNTEGLLALPVLQAVAGVRVVIIQGIGGRELLAETLLGKGAHVERVACYHRVLPMDDISSPLEAWRLAKNALLVCTSASSLENLAAMLGEAHQILWQQTPLLVSSARLADKARELGYQGTIVQADSALDADILKQLLAG